MSLQITSFFTNNSIPAIGLTPTIRIWQVEENYDNTLIIGSPEGTHDPGTGIGTDGIMIEIFDKSVGIPGGGGLPIGGSRDGFYTFTFIEAMGYQSNKSYVIRCDGGNSLNTWERYQVNSIDPSNNVDAIANNVWDVPATDHLQVGTTGEKLSQTNANTQLLALSMVDVEQLLSLLLKYETNRTKIDPTNKTMTIYDDDCTTPLRTFNLLDSNGDPSISEICERIPTSSGTTDGLGTCI